MYLRTRRILDIVLHQHRIERAPVVHQPVFALLSCSAQAWEESLLELLSPWTAVSGMPGWMLGWHWSQGWGVWLGLQEDLGRT